MLFMLLCLSCAFSHVFAKNAFLITLFSPIRTPKKRWLSSELPRRTLLALKTCWKRRLKFCRSWRNFTTKMSSVYWTARRRHSTSIWLWSTAMVVIFTIISIKVCLPSSFTLLWWSSFCCVHFWPKCVVFSLLCQWTVLSRRILFVFSFDKSVCFSIFPLRLFVNNSRTVVVVGILPGNWWYQSMQQ